jgi:acetoin utilization protein AcuC
MWDPRLIGYDFGRGHPLAPIRVDLTMRLATEFGVFDQPHVRLDAAPPADEKTLLLLHQAEYLAAVRRAGEDPDEVDLYRGLGTDDVPTFTGMYDASALVVGQSVAAAEAVWSGEALHAVNIAGGLHHAMAGTASGFCVFNDVALGIARLLELGATRVAYVDVDVHHGDGTQALFWGDPRVLTISLHESGRYLFPGTGFADEVGGAGAEGRADNVALPPATDDAAWLRAFDAVVPPLLRAFSPEVLVTQHGCDSHVNDPLAHLSLTVDGHRTSYARLHELAHEVAGGRWLVTGGGGYDLVGVVPRSWTHLLAEACGAPIDPESATAPGWQNHVRSLGGTPPQRMTDGSPATFAPWDDPAAPPDPDSALDRTVQQTRDAVFPRHGLTA